MPAVMLLEMMLEEIACHVVCLSIPNQTAKIHQHGDSQILPTMVKNVACMEGWGSRADSGSLQQPQFLGSSMCGYILKQRDAIVFQVSAARGIWNELGLSRKGSVAPFSRRNCGDLARGMIWTH